MGELEVIILILSSVIVLLIIAGTVLSIRFKHARDRFEQIFLKSNDAMFLVDMYGKIKKANKVSSELFRYDLKVLKKMAVFDLHKPEDIPKAKEMFENIKMRPGSKFELELVRSDQESIDVEISASLIDKSTMLAIMRDISGHKLREVQMKKKAEELQRINKLMIGRELKMKEMKQHISNNRK